MKQRLRRETEKSTILKTAKLKIEKSKQAVVKQTAKPSRLSVLQDPAHPAKEKKTQNMPTQYL